MLQQLWATSMLTEQSFALAVETRYYFRPVSFPASTTPQPRPWNFRIHTPPPRQLPKKVKKHERIQKNHKPTFIDALEYINDGSIENQHNQI
jgi:hypothetical protein